MKTKMMVACLFMILMLGFSACDGSKIKISDKMSPSQTVEAFLESFKAQEWDSLDQIYAGSGEDFSSAYGLAKGENENSDELQEAFMSRLYDFDYKIGEESIAEGGETATVEITTKAYNMVDVFNAFYQEYMEKALDTYSGKSGDMKEADLEKMAASILQEKVEAAEKDYEGSAAITLTKVDDRWIVDEMSEANPDFLNAISGGMLDVASDVVNSIEEGK